VASDVIKSQREARETHVSLRHSFICPCDVLSTGGRADGPRGDHLRRRAGGGHRV
jgi:hypothetical protein